MKSEACVVENIYKISIITATFNEKRNLPGLIASLRAQEDKNFEWIVADGGSTDGSLEILRQVNDLDIVIDSRPDFGLYDALNRAVKMCSHDYYLVLGADDILYADGVRNYRKSLKSESLCVVIGSVRVNGRIRSGFFPDKGWLGAGHVVTEHSVGMLINKRLHEAVGFYSNEYRQCADAYFIKKIMRNKMADIYALDAVVGEFGVKGVSNTNVARGLCEGLLVQLETEKNKPLQLLLFIMRILKNAISIVRS